MSWVHTLWYWLFLSSPAAAFNTAAKGWCQEPLFCQSNIETPSVNVMVELEDNTMPGSGSENSECVIVLDDGRHYLIPIDERGNLTYRCDTTSSTLLWQIGGCDDDELSYQLVDRDEFALNGVLVQDSVMGASSLILYQSGRSHLSERLQSCWFTIQCVAIVDDLNVYGGAVYTVELYDRPGSPTDLQLQCNPTSNTSAVLQWSTPDYRTISPEVPLSYTVTVNVTDEENDNIMMLMNVTTVNTSVEIQVDSNVTSRPLLFTVVAMNCVGSSDPAELTSTIPPDIDVGGVRDSIIATVDFANQSQLCVGLAFRHIPCPGCSQYSYTEYTATALDGTVNGTVSSSSSGSDSLTIQLCSTDFEVNQVYTISLIACHNASDICQDIAQLQISTSQLQSASVIFYGTLVRLACYYADNVPVGDNSCEFRFSLVNGEDEVFEIPRTATSAFLQTNNTREAYVGFEVQYGSEVVCPSVTDKTGTDFAAATVNATNSLLSLDCTLTPTSIATGCLFVLPISTSDSSLETFAVLVDDTGDSGSRCVYVQTDLTQTQSRVYVLYDRGLIDSSTSYVVDIQTVQSGNLPQCKPPPVTPSVIPPVVSSSTVCPTTTVTTTTDPTIEVASSKSRLSGGAVAGISVAIVIPVSLIVGFLLGGFAAILCNKQRNKIPKNDKVPMTTVEQNLSTKSVDSDQQTTEHDSSTEETKEV